MSTRSNIGIIEGDGAAEAVYCHFDGYFGGAGATLSEHYTTAEKVRALVALGELSQLGEQVAPPDDVPHSYRRAADGVTVAYGRDRGEADVAGYRRRFVVSGSNVAAVADGMCFEEYLYLFDDRADSATRGQWLASHIGYSDTSPALRPLAEILNSPEGDL